MNETNNDFAGHRSGGESVPKEGDRIFKVIGLDQVRMFFGFVFFKVRMLLPQSHACITFSQIVLLGEKEQTLNIIFKRFTKKIFGYDYDMVNVRIVCKS